MSEIVIFFKNSGVHQYVGKEVSTCLAQASNPPRMSFTVTP